MFRKLEAYEYDIRKCNISVLRTLNIIDDDTYKRLYDAPRMERQVFVGKMMRDKEVYFKNTETSLNAVFFVLRVSITYRIKISLK